MAAPTQAATPTPSPTSPAPREADQQDRGFLVDGIQESDDTTLDLRDQEADQETESSTGPAQEIMPEVQSEQPTPAPEVVIESETTPEAESEAPTENEPTPEPEPAPELAQPTPEPPVTPEPVVAQVDLLYKKIEGVLEEDMKEAYLKMDPDLQQKFKEKGEETAVKIRKLLGAAKINTRKIFHLIRKWLKMVPGVNRFFLEQEAKIKTDKINLVAGKEKKDQEQTIA
jgi:hypothetical protein